MVEGVVEEKGMCKGVRGRGGGGRRRPHVKKNRPRFVACPGRGLSGLSKVP